MLTIRKAISLALALTLVTCFYLYVFRSANHTTIALTYLLVSLVAGTYGFMMGVVASVLCGFCFNFFFLPPVGTLTIHDPQNLVAFAVFLITALTANRLSSSARHRSEESEKRRNELSKLYEVSRIIISTPDAETAAPLLTGKIREIFGFPVCMIASREEQGKWHLIGNPATDLPVPESILQDVYESGYLRRTRGDSAHSLLCAPLKAGARVTGVLISAAKETDPATMEALAGLVALALERLRFLKDLSQTEALKQSDQLKSAILASVSHDLRTPLTSIRTAVESLLSRDVDWNEDSRQEFYTIIDEEVDRLSRLVQNLLEMARIEAGECRPVKEWGSVSEMISDVLTRCAESLSRNQIKLDVPQDLPMVRWDERLMNQVLTNLLENAAHYSPQGSEIVLGAELNKSVLLIRVQDRGPGIPADEIPRIFERFYRGRSASKDRKGTGMGLAIARGIMEAHGGAIRVESPGVRGSTFTMEIPVETMDAKG